MKTLKEKVKSVKTLLERITRNVRDQDHEEAVEFFVGESGTSTFVVEEVDGEEIFVENTVELELETDEKD